MTLTSKQRASSTAKPTASNPYPNRENGLNDQIKTSVRQALDARELIKVTLLQNTDENIHEVAEILEEEIGVDTVQKSDVSWFCINNQARKKIVRLLKS